MYMLIVLIPDVLVHFYLFYLFLLCSCVYSNLPSKLSSYVLMVLLAKIKAGP
jgi:hypothetical protein